MTIVWIAIRLVWMKFCLAIWYQRSVKWYFIITNDIMVLAFHIAHVVIDVTGITKKIILIAIDAMAVAMNAWHTSIDTMQPAIDVNPFATNSNAAQPNYGHRNHAIMFSHLIFVFSQAINHLRRSAGIYGNWNYPLSNWYYESGNRFHLYYHRCYPNCNWLQTDSKQSFRYNNRWRGFSKRSSGNFIRLPSLRH